MLIPEDLIFIGVCDLAAQVRGKSVPASDFAMRLQQGVGYTPANIALSAFGNIGSTPFGTIGDITLRPDPTTEVHIPFESGAPEHFCLADILAQDGTPWEFCPRHFLRRALARLESATGCRLLVSFEQEFVYTGASGEPRRAYALDSFREQGLFGSQFLAALRVAGMSPDSFLAEYGPRQYEVTVAPSLGLRAADDAVMLRELARSLAARAGHRAIFSPMLEPNGVGNGTHIHLSLRDQAGNAVMHQPGRPYGLSEMAEHFAAGILDQTPALTAITTPTVCSFYRLTPDRWAPTWANVGLQDRAASLRVCPGPAKRFNLEYRVADATACPYLALGALVHAGVDGVERGLALPTAPAVPFAEMASAQRRETGMQPLPRTLGEALDLLRQSSAAPGWFGSPLLDLYLTLKQEEEQSLAGQDATTVCDRYAAIF